MAANDDEDETTTECESELASSSRSRARTQGDDLISTNNSSEASRLRARIDKIMSSDEASATSKEQRIDEFTALFKELINQDESDSSATTTSTQQRQQQQRLGALFFALVEYMSDRWPPHQHDDKLASQLASLLVLQIDSLDALVLRKTVDLFVSHIDRQASLTSRCMDVFVEVFKYVKTNPAANQPDSTGNEYVQRKLAEMLNMRSVGSSQPMFIYLFELDKITRTTKKTRWTEPTALNVLSLVR